MRGMIMGVNIALAKLKHNTDGFSEMSGWRIADMEDICNK